MKPIRIDSDHRSALVTKIDDVRIRPDGDDGFAMLVGGATIASWSGPDAEQRRQIRAEAIAECLDWVRAHASCEGIAEKIARDIEENVKP